MKSTKTQKLLELELAKTLSAIAVVFGLCCDECTKFNLEKSRHYPTLQALREHRDSLEQRLECY